MRILIIEYANEKKVNDECTRLEGKGFVILDINYTHQSYNHYVAYAVIKYEEFEESSRELQK